ncbi:flagellar biosynthesis sigma factor [Paraburkholderia sp. 31.1]|uniref:flagellar biosynthesis sigma factor n=1 Tax=Paraburkholderia sp. 31.1 TaxID=2615205 RepID=UPI001655F073|nr:flagellar biosynthesis sigma factor [Paraburkholderia sp. 31.1]MBC8720535.1 flagellar biosynthesis sigma factor [Paraburkholderia sp. 31.1]
MSRKKIRRLVYLGCLVIGCTIVGGIYAVTRPADEVLLMIGEPYEQVRQQSRSTLPAAEPGANWGGVINRPARLRFTDPQYGFSTPVAKFMAVSYDEHGKVDSVRMSPQVTILPLDETMAIVLDLQEQLRRGGWRQILVEDSPPLEDTPTVRAKIRGCAAPTGYWQAGDKYQLGLNVRCFRTDSHPDLERYLITLDVASPWLEANR